MVMCTNRALVLLVCVGLLSSIQLPCEVHGSKSAVLKNHDSMLKKVDANILNTDKKKPAAHVSKKLDTTNYQSSKRKVQRGSDPIHNRT
ncbi:hypothetical protein ACP275_05G009100 [Erythranthe tilingii]